MIGKDAEWGDFPNVVPALNAEVTPPRLEHTRAPVSHTVSSGWLCVWHGKAPNSLRGPSGHSAASPQLMCCAVLCPQIHDEIEAIFATKTLDEWTELSAAAELTFAPVATLPEYIASEQAQAAGAVAELEHPMFPDGLKLPNTVRAPTRPRPCRIEC